MPTVCVWSTHDSLSHQWNITVKQNNRKKKLRWNKADASISIWSQSNTQTTGKKLTEKQNARTCQSGSHTRQYMQMRCCISQVASVATIRIVIYARTCTPSNLFTDLSTCQILKVVKISIFFYSIPFLIKYRLQHQQYHCKAYKSKYNYYTSLLPH